MTNHQYAAAIRAATRTAPNIFFKPATIAHSAKTKRNTVAGEGTSH